MSSFRGNRPRNIDIHRFSSKKRHLLKFEVIPSEPLSILINLGTDINISQIYIAVVTISWKKVSFGAFNLKTLIFTGFRAKKRHLVKFEVIGPHVNLVQYLLNLAQTFRFDKYT